ncbi:MAG: NAD(P)H-binding protein [Nitrospiraceae bacterium]
MYVVLGVTGNTGSVVAETLLQKHAPVRVVVRTAEKGAPWKAKGAEVAVASYDDVPAMTQAMRGAKGVYLLVPPSYGAQPWLLHQHKTMDQATAAVKASGVPHVVFLSSVGGQLSGGTGPIRAAHYGEQVLASAAPALTILRPTYFMQNWGATVGMAKAQGVLPMFMPPQAKLPMISTVDIGRIGAERLLAGGNGRQIVEMTGPEEYSGQQAAEILTQLLGRTVTAQQAPLSAVVPTMKSFGFSDDAAALFEEMYTAFSKQTIHSEFPEKVVRGTVSLHDALRRMV